MKLSKNIQVDIRNFFLSGKFDFLELGQTQVWILANFPDPDWYDESAFRYRKNDIWRYGEWEFHFADGRLNMIYTDCFQNKTDGCKLSGGVALDLDAWILNDAANLTLQKVIYELNQNDIDFEKYRGVSDWIVLYLPVSQIELCFGGENLINPNDFSLLSLSWCERPFLGKLRTYGRGKIR